MPRSSNLTPHSRMTGRGARDGDAKAAHPTSSRTRNGRLQEVAWPGLRTVRGASRSKRGWCRGLNSPQAKQASLDFQQPSASGNVGCNQQGCFSSERSTSTSHAMYCRQLARPSSNSTPSASRRRRHSSGFGSSACDERQPSDPTPRSGARGAGSGSARASRRRDRLLGHRSCRRGQRRRRRRRSSTRPPLPARPSPGTGPSTGPRSRPRPSSAGGASGRPESEAELSPSLSNATGTRSCRPAWRRLSAIPNRAEPDPDPPGGTDDHDLRALIVRSDPAPLDV